MKARIGVSQAPLTPEASARARELDAWFVTGDRTGSFVLEFHYRDGVLMATKVVGPTEELKHKP